MSLDAPAINGKRSNGNSVRILINGQPVYGVKGVTYAHLAQEVGVNFSLNNQPDSLSFGQQSYAPGTITLFRNAAQAVVRLMSVLPERFQTLVDIEVTIRNGRLDPNAQVDLLEACGLAGIEGFAASAGTVDALTEDFQFQPTRIWHDGICFGDLDDF